MLDGGGVGTSKPRARMGGEDGDEVEDGGDDGDPKLDFHMMSSIIEQALAATRDA